VRGPGDANLGTSSLCEHTTITMRNRAVNVNEQDYMIFVSFLGQRLQLAGIYGALLIMPLFYGRLFGPSLFQCVYLRLSALRFINCHLQGVTVFRICLRLSAFSLGSAFQNVGHVLGWPLNIKMIKSSHNPATIWKDASHCQM
jgi:hypothetical protein